MNVAMAFALGGLVVAAALIGRRLVVGPSLADRVVALDALLLVVVAGVGVESARTGDGTYLDLLIVTSLLALVGTLLVARFIEHRGT